MLKLSQRRIVLIVTGGIAAYKSLDLIRQIREYGGQVRCILTSAACQFVTPLAVSTLSENRVYQDLFSLTDEAEMGHIRLSREADLLVVAPASADFLAKMATGQADDLATTTLLATNKPVVVVPAMNPQMWHHPATQTNIATLKTYGIHFIEPQQGLMACGEIGIGRMAEPQNIIETISHLLTQQEIHQNYPLTGLRALVTSGPTQEPLDPVRFLTNRSSGKQGHAIAQALHHRGMQTTLVTGPTQQPDPHGVNTISINTAQQMLDQCLQALPVDVLVCAAAVSDWCLQEPSLQKLKKKQTLSLKFTQTPDVLSTLAKLKYNRPPLVIGFAAETNNVLEYAQQKRKKKNCDWIVANDVSPEKNVFGSPTNTVYLIQDQQKISPWPTDTKYAIAERLAEEIQTYFLGKTKSTRPQRHTESLSVYNPKS